MLTDFGKFFSGAGKNGRPLTDREKLALELRETVKRRMGVNHAELCLIGTVWYNVDLSAAFFKLKECTKYGQFFGIESVDVRWGKAVDEIREVTLVMKDCGLDTGMRIFIPVSELYEWMEPIPDVKLSDLGLPAV